MTARLALLATLVIGCGTVQNAVQQEVRTGGFPAKPWPQQRRPGPDGTCGGKHPAIIVVNGGCWAWVEVDLADCEAAAKEGDYLVPHEGKCYYPIFKLEHRQPTSSVQQPSEARAAR